MVLGKLPVPGRPTLWMIVGQGPIALAVGAGGGCLDIFTLFYLFSSLSPSLWETARYRLKYCLKGPVNPKQPTNQPTNINNFVFLGSIVVRLVYCICLSFRFKIDIHSSTLLRHKFYSFMRINGAAIEKDE